MFNSNNNCSAASSVSSPSGSSSIMFSNILGQGKVNQLGGVFINGRPLPNHLRAKIIELSAAGVRPCVISRQLRVSHGCVSKILGRYTETGSIAPGQVGGSRPRVAMQSLEKQILKLKRDNPSMFSCEIREKLIELNYCTRNQAPSVAAINRLLRSRGLKSREQIGSQPMTNVNGDDDSSVSVGGDVPEFCSSKSSCWVSQVKSGSLKKHSIDSILGNCCADDAADNQQEEHEQDGQQSETEDESCNNQKRRNRTCFLPEQLEILERFFQEFRYPDQAARDRLAKETNLSDNKIQVWFSNRRARWRKHVGATAFSGNCNPLVFSFVPPPNTVMRSNPIVLAPPPLPSAMSWLQSPIKLNGLEGTAGHFRLPPLLHHPFVPTSMNLNFS